MSTSSGVSEPVAYTASCTNQIEPYGVPCLGTLRFGPNDIQAACDTCGAWCGWMIADYEPGQARLSWPGNVAARARREQPATDPPAPTSSPA